MASYNRVVLVGNITRDVEVRYLQSGTAVTEIGLAINDRRKNQQGEWIEDTTFVDVTLWGRTAEVAGEYLSKGSPILVEGRLKLDTWETDGQKRSRLKVVGEKMQMLSGRAGGRADGRAADRAADRATENGGDSQATQVENEYSETAAAGSPSSSAPQDDIPF